MPLPVSKPDYVLPHPALKVAVWVQLAWIAANVYAWVATDFSHVRDRYVLAPVALGLLIMAVNVALIPHTRKVRRRWDERQARRDAERQARLDAEALEIAEIRQRALDRERAMNAPYDQDRPYPSAAEFRKQIDEEARGFAERMAVREQVYQARLAARAGRHAATTEETDQ